MVGFHADTKPHADTIHEPLRCLAVLCSLFACLSGLLLGYDIGVTNGALQPLSKTLDLSEWQQGLVVGFLNLFAMPSCLVAGPTADYLGRRGAIALGAVLFLSGNLLMTFAQGIGELLAGRILAGLAVGLTLVTEPLYTAETSPARLRGMLNTNVETSFNVGIVFGFSASWALDSWDATVSWRYMFGLCLFAPVLSLLGVACVLPESPRWLASRGKLLEAKQVLEKLLGPKEAQATFEMMKAKIDEEDPTMSLQEMFTTWKFLRLLLIGSSIAFFSQACGIECIMYYSNKILERGGLSRTGMLLSTMLMGFLKLGAIIFQGFLVDGCGRRPMLALSSLGTGLSMFALSAAFVFDTDWHMKVIPIFAFIFSFSLGFGPIVYTYNAELYPSSMRPKALSLSMSIGRLMSAVVSLSFPGLAYKLSLPGVFILFGIASCIGAVFILFAVPETAGRILDQEESDSDSSCTDSSECE